MIFYLFIYLIYAAEDEGETTYQYKVTQYQTTNVSITMIAECIECKIYYVNKNNYVAMALNITILFLSKQHLNIIIEGLSFDYQWQLPHTAPFPDYQLPNDNFSSSDIDYLIETTSDPLRIIVKRNSTNETIFDTSTFRIIYSRFYLEITTILPSKYIFGLGERNEIFWLKNGTYSLWNRVPRYNISNDTNFSSNSFGSQPIYLSREQSFNYHMSFLRNLNAMDIIFSDDSPYLQYRIVFFSFFKSIH